MWDLSDTGLPVKLSRLFFFYVTPALVPALLMWPLVMQRGRARLAAVTLLLVVVTVLLEGTAGHAHYASPAVGAFFAVVVQGLRRLRLWRWRGKPSGQLLTAGLLAMYVLSSLHFWAVKWKDEPAYGLNNWCLARARILARLQGDSRKHLILVRYRPDHTIHIDWVKNRADIDNAKVVWAHEREKRDLARLFRHFPDRRVWLLEADAVPFRLVPYPVGSVSLFDKR